MPATGRCWLCISVGKVPRPHTTSCTRRLAKIHPTVPVPLLLLTVNRASHRQEELPNASTATRRQLSSLLKTAFTRRRPRPLQQQVSAAAASSHTSESPFVTPTAASGAVSTSPDAVPAAAAPPPSPPAAAAVGVSSVVAAAGRGVIGGLTAVTGAAARVTAAALPIRRRRSTSGGGGGFGARRLSTDELMDDDDGGGGRGGGGAEGDGDASVMPGTTLVLDELDDNASSTLVPSAAAMTEAGGTGPGSGPGAFCYFKVRCLMNAHRQYRACWAAVGTWKRRAGVASVNVWYSSRRHGGWPHGCTVP